MKKMSTLRFNEITIRRCVQVRQLHVLLEMQIFGAVRQKLLLLAVSLEMRNESEKANYQEHRGKIIVIRAEIIQMATQMVIQTETIVMQVVLGQRCIIVVKRRFRGEAIQNLLRPFMLPHHFL